MKRKVLFGLGALAFAAVLTFGIINQVQASPRGPAGGECANGCKADGNGCYCNGWYGCYREA